MEYLIMPRPDRPDRPVAHTRRHRPLSCSCPSLLSAFLRMKDIILSSHEKEIQIVPKLTSIKLEDFTGFR